MVRIRFMPETNRRIKIIMGLHEISHADSFRSIGKYVLYCQTRRVDVHAFLLIFLKGYD